MKKIFLALTFFIATSLSAQIKVSQGNNSQPFTLTKQPAFTSFSTDNADYFVIKRVERMLNVNTLIIADKSGTITASKEVRINNGVFNNNFDVNNLLVVGNKPILFIEGHNKDVLKNTLEARIVDNNGNVAPTGTVIGSMDMPKMSNPGDWYAVLTPDKKHIAVIGKAPHEKDAADQFKYFIFNEDLKEVRKGQFSFTGNTKQFSVFKFLASDKGDFYIISEDLDKSYKVPILYKFTEGGQAMVIPVMMANPDQKNLSYTAQVSPAGDLVIGGYIQKRKTFVAGDPEATGIYLFNSAKPNEVKTYNFDKPLINLTARNIVYNGDTFFLVGEQYKADKQVFRGSVLSPAALENIYDYTHNDIMVTGFASDLTKKFDIPISRKWAPVHEFDSDLMVASALVNNKLALVYNDQYSKYVDDRNYRNLKLPVAVMVTNDGLMENPVTFEKQLDVKVSTYTLYPQFFSTDGTRLTLLSGNAQSVKTNIFQ